jgi:hypothetical protein
MQSGKALGDEIIFDHRPVAGEKRIDVALDQHGPNRRAVGVVRKGLIIVPIRSSLGAAATAITFRPPEISVTSGSEGIIVSTVAHRKYSVRAA